MTAEVWYERAADQSTRTAQDLVESFYNMGMSWNDLAGITGTTVSIARKWRKGTAEPNSMQLLTLVDLAVAMDMIREAGVDDPAAWLETPVLLDGAMARPMEVAVNGYLHDLPAMVENQSKFLAAMNRLHPGWQLRAKGWEVFTDTDGHRSIRLT